MPLLHFTLSFAGSAGIDFSDPFSYRRVWSMPGGLASTKGLLLTFIFPR